MKDTNKFDDITRRSAMQSVALGTLGVAMGTGMNTPELSAAIPGARVASAKQVIYLYLNGGMSQLDTFDPKPQQPDLMGATKTIPTHIDQYEIGADLPTLAKISDRLAIVNSMTVPTGSHVQANYIAHTNYEPRSDILHPCMGSWVSRLSGRNNVSIPGNVRINGGSPTGGGFFDSSHTPLFVRRPDQGIQYSSLPKSVTNKEFNQRRSLLNRINDNYLRQHKTKRVKDYNYAYDAAISLMKSEDLKAFDLSLEDDVTQAAYGDHSFGKGCLLARRLIEQKVRFVEVNFSGWDHHFQIYDNFPEKAQQLDQAMSTLILDMEQRGLLDDTLIVLTTEFGRTPHITEARKGRDHHPQAFSTVLAGGGIQGGQVYGKTDETCANVIDKAVRHKDINSTVAYALGLPLAKVLHSPSGRPFTVTDKGTPLYDLFERGKNA